MKTFLRTHERLVSLDDIRSIDLKMAPHDSVRIDHEFGTTILDGETAVLIRDFFNSSICITDYEINGFGRVLNLTPSYAAEPAAPLPNTPDADHSACGTESPSEAPQRPLSERIRTAEKLLREYAAKVMAEQQIEANDIFVVLAKDASRHYAASQVTLQTFQRLRGASVG